MNHRIKRDCWRLGEPSLPSQVATARNGLRLCAGGCSALVSGGDTCLVCETRAAGKGLYSDPWNEWQLPAVLEASMRLHTMTGQSTSSRSEQEEHRFVTPGPAPRTSRLLNPELSHDSCMPYPLVTR